MKVEQLLFHLSIANLMDLTQLTPKQRDLWRFLITYSTNLTNRLDFPGGTNKSKDYDVLHYVYEITDKLSDFLSDEGEGGEIFLLQFLDEPIPTLWYFIINALKDSEIPIVLDIFEEISSLDHHTFLTMINGRDAFALFDRMLKERKEEAQTPPLNNRSDLRSVTATILAAKSRINGDIIKNTSDGKLLQNIVENNDPKLWFHHLYDRFMTIKPYLHSHYSDVLPDLKHSDFDGYMKRIELRNDPDQLKVEIPNRIRELLKVQYKTLVYWLGKHVTKETDPEFIRNLMDVYLYMLRDRVGRSEFKMVFMKLLRHGKWRLTTLTEEILPAVLERIPIEFEQNGEIRENESNDISMQIIDDLSNQIAGLGELKDLISLNNLLIQPIQPGNNQRVRAQDPKQRTILMNITSQLGNVLVKNDSSLQDTIGSVLSTSQQSHLINSQLKSVIDERRCCKMHGRTGDVFCNVCGRVIPEEWRIE